MYDKVFVSKDLVRISNELMTEVPQLAKISSTAQSVDSQISPETDKLTLEHLKNTLEGTSNNKSSSKAFPILFSVYLLFFIL